MKWKFAQEKGEEFRMRIKNLLWLVAPMLIGGGCTTYHSATYTGSDVVVPSATSSSGTVRVYPTPSPRAVETAPVTSPVPADEWGTAVAVRNVIAADPYLKGAARNVDIEIVRGAAILRGTVASEYDRQEMAARVGQVPGVTVVDNRLVVAVK
jgi:hypothetical protein